MGYLLEIVILIIGIIVGYNLREYFNINLTSKGEKLIRK